MSPLCCYVCAVPRLLVCPRLGASVWCRETHLLWLGHSRHRQVTDNQLGWQVMTKRLVRIEEFREAITDLKAAKWRAFIDNFLPVALSSGYMA